MTLSAVRIDYRIPILDWKSDSGGYGGVPVDDGDPRGTEPLAEISAYAIAGENFYAREDGANSPYNRRIAGAVDGVWLRTGVLERIVRANRRLAPYGAELFVFDGYRSVETQQGLWDHFEEEIAREKPGLAPGARRKAVVRYVSDPNRFRRDDPATWPAHTTGAAVDCTLRSLKSGALLDMGAAFDEAREISHSDALERALQAGAIPPDDDALNNRRLLHWAMESEGFVNYPLEYWHFDWGDQMYVHNLALRDGNAPAAAWYGYVDPPQRT